MKDILNLIGNTPLINLNGIKVKLEHLNPSGSVKDRIAKYIIEKAEKKKLLKKGYKVVEATSGNSGIAFSMVCAIKGYQMVVVMPKGFTEERQEMMEGYGSRIIFTPKSEDVEGAVKKELSLEKKKGYYLVKQFENPWNIEGQMIMGEEILKQVKKVDCFVAGVGTGGTLIGVGKVLRKKFPNVKLIAVEPAESAVLSGKKRGKHKIEGIGDGFVPGIIKDNWPMVDEIVKIKSKDAIDMTKKLASDYGLMVGISSGANYLAALKFKKKYKNVVTLFPDRGERYLSMDFY